MGGVDTPVGIFGQLCRKILPFESKISTNSAASENEAAITKSSAASGKHARLREPPVFVLTGNICPG